MKIRSLPFYQSLLFCLVFSLIQVFVIQKAFIIYIPLFFNVVFSFFLGLMAPKRGWILIIIQIAIIVSGFYLLKAYGIQANKPQEAEFVSFSIIFPSFTASFLAAFLFKK